MLNKRLNSFRYAWAGVVTLFRTQPNARIHLLFTMAVVAAGIFFGLSQTEWCVVALAIAMVMAAEAFNTALEFLTDLASPDFHPLAGKAKDVAAAAVLLTAIGAAVAGGLIFFPKVYDWLG